MALVRAAGDPHHGALHAFERIVDRIDVGGLRVVDPQHAAALPDRFEPVLDGREAVKRTADRRRGDSRREGCERPRHGVVGVVQALDLQFRGVDLDRGLSDGRREFAVAEESVPRAAGYGVFRREGELLHAQVVFRELLPDHFVVARIDEIVARSLVLRDAHLRIGVVLEAVVVAVEVVGRDVHQHADMRPELVHAVELERA